MSKRIVVCCDGTWSTADQRDRTNVAKLAHSVADRDQRGAEQRIKYHKGVGTSPWERLRGGAFGFGLSRDVRDCYGFIVQTFDPGDEIFLFGYSRGAYTARSTAGLVYNCGILRREHADGVDEAYSLYRDRDPNTNPTGLEAELFRRSYSVESRTIRFIGVWDTVGSLGIPLDGLRLVHLVNKRWQFHDTDLSPFVENAFQALAIDERRRPFRPTMWTQKDSPQNQTLKQVWFAGGHSDVGGGNTDAGLSDIALLWLVERAKAAGLAFRNDHFSPILPPGDDMAEARREGRFVVPNPDGPIHASRTGIFRLLRSYDRKPGDETGSDGKIAPGQSVSSTAQLRLQRKTEGYDPPGLARYLQEGRPVTTV